jgi:hypothetical protein
MVRLFPSSLRVEFDVVRSLEEIKQQTDFLFRQKRGKSTSFEDFGITYLPFR